MAVEEELSHQNSLTFCYCVTGAAEGQSDKIVSDTEMCLEQKCVSEFLHVEKNGTR